MQYVLKSMSYELIGCYLLIYHLFDIMNSHVFNGNTAVKSVFFESKCINDKLNAHL